MTSRFFFRLLMGTLMMAAAAFSAPLYATTCTINTGSAGVAFGNYDPVSAVPATSNGTISVTCTPNCSLFFIFICIGGYNGVNASLTLSPGNSGSYLSRSLKFGADALAYNLYMTPDYTTTVFGDGTASTGYVTYCFTGANVASCSGATYTGSPASGGGGNNGTAQSQGVPIYGKILSNQDAAVGSYTDTITATLSF
jgi:spore coat protein U-like protein